MLVEKKTNILEKPRYSDSVNSSFGLLKVVRLFKVVKLPRMVFSNMSKKSQNLFYDRGSHLPFVNKCLSKAIMKGTRLMGRFLNDLNKEKEKKIFKTKKLLCIYYKIITALK